MYKKLVVDTKGNLDTTSRKRLIRTIVEYTVQEKIWVSQKEFPILFDKIKDIFPAECMDVYFVPKSKYNENPSGLLWSNFRYSHSLLKKECGITKNTQKKRKIDAYENDDCMISSAESELIRKDLLVRFEPWRRVLSDWEKTCMERRSELLKHENLSNVFLRWPKYKTSAGKELVDIDFKDAFPENADNMFREFTSCSEEVMKAGAKKAGTLKEKRSFTIDYEMSSGKKRSQLISIKFLALFFNRSRYIFY